MMNLKNMPIDTKFVDRLSSRLHLFGRRSNRVQQNLKCKQYNYLTIKYAKKYQLFLISINKIFTYMRIYE